MTDIQKIALVTFSTAVAALAIPVAIFLVWLPREFDALNSSGEEVAGRLDTIEQGIGEVTASNQTLSKLLSDGHNNSEKSMKMIGFLAAELDSEKKVLTSILSAKFNPSLIDMWEKQGKLEYLSGAKVNGSEFVFLKLVDMNKLSSDDYNLLNEASASNGFKFEVWDASQFPGVNFEYRQLSSIRQIG